MITLYKDGEACSCGQDQLDIMLESGWLFEQQAEPQAKPEEKTTKKKPE
jgi:hypothetical protein